MRTNEESMKYASYGFCSLAILLSLDLYGSAPLVCAQAARSPQTTLIATSMVRCGSGGSPVLPWAWSAVERS